MKTSVFYLVTIVLFGVLPLGCKKIVSKATIHVFDSESGKGIPNVTVSYNPQKGSQLLTLKTDSQGEVVLNNDGGLFNKKVGVAIPKGFSSPLAFENCGNKSSYIITDEILEVPLSKNQMVEVELKRSAQNGTDRADYCLAVIDTHCLAKAGNTPELPLEFNGQKPEVKWGGEVYNNNKVYFDFFPQSPYGKEVRIIKGSACYDFNANEIDTTFYIPPLGEDTTELVLWFDEH